MIPALKTMLDRYHCRSEDDYINALREIIQEIALLGLWRSQFFDKAAFYGGTALRILYGLDRFSEDCDFSLLKPDKTFSLAPYFKGVELELASLGIKATISEKQKNKESAIASAFLKADTRDHLLKIEVPQGLLDRMHRNSILTIKLEVDTDPPPHFETERKTLLLPIPFAVNTYRLPDLFAGKVHAILERTWKSRVKGRDYFDFVWYISRGTPLHLRHLEARLSQSGAWSQKSGWKKGKLTPDSLKNLLRTKFNEVTFTQAKKDCAPFIRDPASLDLWSSSFFCELLDRMIFSK